jgi:hypothetical protein
MTPAERPTRTARWCAAVLLSAGLLAGCGGGGDGGPVTAAPLTAVPAAIGNSVDALLAFALGLITTDTGEPLSLGTVQPAISDTAEPRDL